jgi:hypothetical protein
MRIRRMVTAAFTFALLLVHLVGSDGQAQSPSTHMARALDQAVARINTRSDLAGHRVGAFNRDSLDARVMSGLGRTSDSTLIGWFTGFSVFVNGTDSLTCHDLMKEAPTASRLAAVRSTMDSAAVEGWVKDWEAAVVASYLSPPHPPVDDEAMMVAVFTLIARLPEAQANLNRKPGGKPPKPTTPASECGTMRQFFAEALTLEDPTRMTLLRGLALTMNEKGKSTFNIQK